MAKSRDSSPALGRCEQVEEAAMSAGRGPKEGGGAEEETGRGGLPLVLESDMDFGVDVFEADTRSLVCGCGWGDVCTCGTEVCAHPRWIKHTSYEQREREI